MFEINDSIFSKLSSAIERAVNISTWPNLPPLKNWFKEIKTLSESFNVRKNKKSFYPDIKKIEAYLIYFFPLNVIRAMHLFEKLLEENREVFNKILKKDKIIFNDLGCGPGTASFAFSLFFPEVHNKTIFNLIDANSQMLNKAKLVMKGNDSKFTLKDILNFKSLNINENSDFIFFANVLNEPEHSADVNFFEKEVASKLSEEGFLIIMEPSLKDSSRRLLELRDNFFKNFRENYFISYPCTFVSECPALKDPGNWCHSGFKWERPEWIRIIDKNLGFNKNEMHYSCIVITKNKKDFGNKIRIVSDRLESKTGYEFFACQESSLHKKEFDKQTGKKIERYDLLDKN